jgi:UDP-N-acetylmuramoyl-tripeptide--D-alanyl-D-alanine ligase
MLELGMACEAAHRDAGAWVAALPVAGLATAGGGMRLAADAARAAGCPDVASFDTPEAAAAHVAVRVTPGDRVLVKGSRGMRMERAVEALIVALERGERARC